MSMGNIAESVNLASPVIMKSVVFIAISIANIEIKLIPSAVRNAAMNGKCCRLIKIKVSNRMLLIKPLTIASSIIKSVGHRIPAI